MRKIVQDVHWEVPYSALKSGTGITSGDMGYAESDKKTDQLLRNYFNQEAAEAVREKLHERMKSRRAHTSVALSMHGKAKDSRSQGHCIQTMVFTHAVRRKEEILEVDIFYRSTEVVKKFLADLNFLPKVIEAACPKPDEIGKVKFHFCNVFLSALFLPIFLEYEQEWTDYFDVMFDNDRRFWNTCVPAISRFFYDKHNYTYRERVKIYELIHKRYPRPRVLEMREYFEDCIRRKNENL